MKTENDVLYHHHNNLPDPQTFTDNNIRLAEQEREASIRLRGLIGRFDKFLLWPLYILYILYRPIKDGQFNSFENLASHFIGIQIFQIDFPLIALEGFTNSCVKIVQ